MDSTATRARVLCVDDEANVLAGLSVHLHRRYDVVTATSGAAGLAKLAGDPAISIVVSDMRMPGMSGAEFLSEARRLRPDAVRLLLTGHLDLDAAIARNSGSRAANPARSRNARSSRSSLGRSPSPLHDESSSASATCTAASTSHGPFETAPGKWWNAAASTTGAGSPHVPSR